MKKKIVGGLSGFMLGGAIVLAEIFLIAIPYGNAVNDIPLRILLFGTLAFFTIRGIVKG